MAGADRAITTDQELGEVPAHEVSLEQRREVLREDGMQLLAARGVRVGMQVTSHKVGLRLGRNRFVARSEDDRAGTTALLLAINQIDPDRLPGKVIFTWSVHEEGGLLGAAAMARRYARSARRIYSIDTFVSSDAPLESPHFAHASV